MNLAATARRSKSQKIREKLDYPVIDADGHMLEVEPVLLDFLKVVGGPKIVQRYVDMLSGGSLWGWYKATPEERVAARIKRAPFWFFPAANTLDRATSMFPGLMRSRLDEFGIDFSFIYPTLAILFAGMDDEEMRKAVTRAINTMNAELYAPHKDRLTPAAVIPMHTPQEALDELNFAVGTLGMKAAMVEGVVRRPITGKAGSRDLASAAASYWIDPLALDSPYDYDPVWQRFTELGVAPTMHTSTMGWVDRTSISNVTYNHIGHFAAGAHAFCKALVLGGVREGDTIGVLGGTAAHRGALSFSQAVAALRSGPGSPTRPGSISLEPDAMARLSPASPPHRRQRDFWRLSAPGRCLSLPPSASCPAYERSGRVSLDYPWRQGGCLFQ